jgi:GDPmannose 4,6-dehydratase
MRALIFGGSGQDGFYLKQSLMRDRIEVTSAARSAGDLIVDVSDAALVAEVIRCVRPDLIFHLAAKSSVSHEHLWENHASIATGTLAILEAVDRFASSARVFIAGSALQFINEGLPLNEDSRLDSSSPYCCARNYALHVSRYFRSRGHRVYFGFLFNHDSRFRTSCHLNMRIAESAARAAIGQPHKLRIGDLEAEKEFNFAGDIADAMLRILQQEDEFEFVVGAGQAFSVLKWVELCYQFVGLDWRDHVDSDSEYKSPYQRLVSDPNRLLRLGWLPSVGISELADDMMKEAMRRINGELA